MGDWTHEEEVVILGLAPQVLEDALLPVAFHVVPVFNLTMFDRVTNLVRLAVGESFVSNVEVEVFDPSL